MGRHVRSFGRGVVGNDGIVDGGVAALSAPGTSLDGAGVIVGGVGGRADPAFRLLLAGVSLVSSFLAVRISGVGKSGFAFFEGTLPVEVCDRRHPQVANHAA